MGVSIIVTIIAFGIMVMLHELGHFAMAKKFGVTIHEFSIGMGPLIFKWGKGETQYSLRLLPLGGYVKLEGEDEESDNPRAFSNISPIKRICILVAGAAMNILLGFVCFVIINNVYPNVQVPVISEIVENSAAEEAGLTAGDEIIRLNNTPVATQSDVSLFMMGSPEVIEVTYLRDGVKEKVTLSPAMEDGRLLIGFKPSIKKLSFFETFEFAYYDTRYVVKAVLVSVKMLFTGEAKVSDMSGPVGIVQVVDDTAQVASAYGLLAVIMQILMLFAMISVNLGVFNLLPFPALDGGSIIFAFIELVTRKKLRQEVLGYINLIGLVLILGLGIFVMYSDIMKLL
ncbi:MAG: site-2 protease family protein [Clostridia bacterium]|nr:site-2 protease family protein [Clostridia bacterium]